MKKILLSLLCLVGFIAANAVEVSVKFSDKGYTNGQEVKSVELDDNITLLFDKGSNSNTCKYYNTGTAMRVYGGGTMTVQGASGVTISKVAMTTQSSNPVKSGSKVSAGTLTYTTTQATIDGINAESTTFTQGGTSGHVRIQTVTVEYSVGEATQANTPVITPNGGEISADTEISIECATEGASIYYTIDGTEPSTSSTLYTAPFTLSASATVKAIAVAEGLGASEVAEAKFTFPFANIAEFIAAANASASTITGPVTVVAQSGSYLFLQDETAKIIAFGSLSNSYNNGDQLSNIKGTYSLYNGLPEMNVVASSFGAATAGAAVEPEEITIEDVAIDNLLAYVKLTGVTIPEGTSKSFTISDATGSMTMYNSAGIEIHAGENMTVIGFISCYNTTVQLLPVEITSASGKDVVAAPAITPNGGAIAPTQEITITCATENASIYYTLDGTEPSVESTLYEGPFTLTEECTVKAIAVAEGMEASAVAEAAFTFINEDIKVATFDFTNPGSLNPAQETPAASAEVSVNNIEFTSNAIKLVCAKNSASNNSRIWGKTDGTSELRTYSSSTITISATNATITSIEFDGGKASATQMTADSGDFASKVWTAADAVSQVVFTAKATTNITTITVNYENTGTGVEEIEVDNNAAVEYYNLQGVKVNNPANGIFIKVQGNKASKVYVK